LKGGPPTGHWQRGGVRHELQKRKRGGKKPPGEATRRSVRPAVKNALLRVEDSGRKKHPIAQRH